jgi:hypothetical protein
VERTRRLTPEVNEKYHVLKTDYTVMQGQYAAYLKKTLLAAGKYNNNKKVGTWTYFDKKGKVSQRYDYDKNLLLYEAPVDSSLKAVYMVDDSLKNNPTFTRPVKIGGQYFGFIKYANIIKLPEDFVNISNELYNCYMELLVSPYGRLASYKLHIEPKRKVFRDDGTIFNININLIDEDDRIFVPATLDKNPIAVRLLIPCYFYRAVLVRL